MSQLQKQYNSIKEKYPDALIWFVVNDCVEVISEDAIKTSAILGTSLTKHPNNGLELTGFKYTQLDAYLEKVIRSGTRVALVSDSQVNDDKTTVKRSVK